MPVESAAAKDAPPAVARKHLKYHSTAADVEQLVSALVAGHGANDVQAARRIAAFHPRFAGLGARETHQQAFSVADAETTIAREHHFATWRQLQAFVRHREGLNDFLQLACLCYFHTDSPANQQRARELLEADPSLAERDIWHAACVGDADAVAAFLDADATLVERLGGHFDWPPLLYACYSRLNLPGRSTLEVARLLLERGADANAHYMWGGQYAFTALTGAYGEGERGPVNQPPHEASEALAALLLNAGANANDSQALYNTMFTLGSGCLRTLLAHGLRAEQRCNWFFEVDGSYVENPEKTLDYQLRWAVREHHVERAKLLIAHGADVGMEDGEGNVLYKTALLGGHPDLADHLLAHGAPAATLNAMERFASACRAADDARARALLAEQPDLVARTAAALPKALPAAAGAGQVEAVRLMLELGFNPNQPVPTALHEAAFRGRTQVVELLLERGADLHVRDDGFAGTPLQWALAGSQEGAAARLAQADIGIFDAALCENLERMGALLDAEPALLETTIGAARGLAARPHSDDWQTPLAYAAVRNRLSAVRLLIERGACADIADGGGRSLAALVRAAGADEMARLLESAASG